MIVRIMGEGQWVLSDQLIGELSALDDDLEACFERNDELRFEDVRDRMLGLVRQKAQPLAEEELAPSEVILPASDATIDEVRAMLGQEGLVPG